MDLPETALEWCCVASAFCSECVAELLTLFWALEAHVEFLPKSDVSIHVAEFEKEGNYTVSRVSICLPHRESGVEGSLLSLTRVTS